MVEYNIGDIVIYREAALAVDAFQIQATIIEIDEVDAVLLYKVEYECRLGDIRMTWVGREDIKHIKPVPTSDTIDPKEAVGSSKLGFSHIPITAMCLLSPGTKNGADKYGKWNWLDLEDGSMSVTTYLDAIQRHLLLFRAGQDNASDSGVHHLDHISAGVAVVRDAMVFGKVKDDRVKLSAKDIHTMESLINNTK